MLDDLFERWYLKNELGDLAERREAREIDPLLLLLVLFVLVFVLIIWLLVVFVFVLRCFLTDDEDEDANLFTRLEIIYIIYPIRWTL